MEFMLVLVYADLGIEVFGPYPEYIEDAKVVSIMDSRYDKPEKAYRLTVGDGSKSVIEVNDGSRRSDVDSRCH